MTMGISARDLSDDDLRRELAHLKEKTDDIDSDGTNDQRANHRRRTAELEEEFLRRNPPSAENASPDGSSAHADNDDNRDAQPDRDGTDDVSPAGPDAGPLDDQPQATAPEPRGSSEDPIDTPTDDPARPTNPA